MLMLGILAGAVLGILTRTHDLLGPRQPGVSAEMSAEVKMWEDLGLDRALVAERLFEIKHPAAAAAVANSAADPQASSVLFKFPADKCSELVNADDVNLLRTLRNPAVYGTWSKLPDIIPEPESLRRLLQEVLCSGK